MDLEIVEAGVDPDHQTDNCDDCQKQLEEGEAIKTCSLQEYLTLCEKCYKKRGNSVR